MSPPPPSINNANNANDRNDSKNSTISSGLASAAKVAVRESTDQTKHALLEGHAMTSYVENMGLLGKKISGENVRKKKEAA